MLTFLCLFSVLTSSCGMRKEVPYNYPARPGTEQWERLTGRDQRVEACQIPESTLRSMSTRSLAVTVLRYPFLNDYLAYNDHLLAAEILEKEFNGFRELLDREDVNEALLSLYQESEAIAEEENNTAEPREDFFLVQNLEFLIGYSLAHGNALNDAQKEAFSAELEEKNRARRAGGIDASSSCEYENFWSEIDGWSS